jgi:hypothetical protein
MSDTESLIKRFPHEVVRIDVPLKGTFDQATQLYESIAPKKDFARVHQLVDAQASWDQVLEQVAENAPHGFMIYWRLPDTPLMRLAGVNIHLPWTCGCYRRGCAGRRVGWSGVVVISWA